MSLKNALDSVYTNLLEWLSLHSNFKLRFLEMDTHEDYLRKPRENLLCLTN